MIPITGLIGSGGRASLPPLSTGFINWIAVGLIIPITLLVAPLGARAAHAMNRHFFMVLVAMRFFCSLYG